MLRDPRRALLHLSHLIVDAQARARQSTSRSSADKAQELEAMVAYGMQPAASFENVTTRCPSPARHFRG